MNHLLSAINVAYDAKTGWSVIKYGVYPNEVGLQVFDREAATAMQTAFNDKLNRLAKLFRGDPVYVGHPDDPKWAKQNPSIPMSAVGRIKELKVEDDGLHLRPAFNEDGKKLVEGDAPAYEAFSPNWGMLPITYKGRAAFRPVELNSIGLTNRPNIPGTFIGLNEALPPETKTSAMNKYIIALLAALGRPVANAAAVTDEQLQSAVNEAVPVATKFVSDAALLTAAVNDKATLQTQLTAAVNDKAMLQTQLTAAQGQVTTAVNEAATLRTSLATERSAHAGVLITTAINEGRLTEAKRGEWLGKFTATNADFPAIEGELKKLTKAVNTKTQTAGLGCRRGQKNDPETRSRITAINEAIEAKMTKLGTKDRNAAYLALQTEGHELFTNAKAE